MTSSIDVPTATVPGLAAPRTPASHAVGPELVDIPVHYRRDADGTWSYRIESPAILGGCHGSREEAERCAVAALARALRGCGDTTAPDEVTGHVTVELRAVW